MPRVKKEKVVEAVDEKPVKEAKTKTEVTVYSGRDVVRVYSKEVHGADFEKLAQSFISDRPDLTIN